MPYENMYPPKNGGLQRCFNLFHQLTKYFDVTGLTHNSKANLLSGAKNYPSIINAAIYTSNDQKAPGDFFSLLPARIGNALKYRWITKNFKQSADSSFLKLYLVLKKILGKNQFDFIILENLSLTCQASWIRKYNKDAKIIYNAYNVDSFLAEHKAKNIQEQKEAESLLHIETNLYKFIDGIFCCSQKDLDAFTEMNNGKIKLGYVVPNGVDTTFFSHTINTSPEQMKNIIFCGSLDYEPNKEGLLWFYKNVWPLVIRKLPDRLLFVVGRGNRQAYTELLSDNTVNFIGEVDEVTPWYRKCNIAIAPLMQGSGTRLKILEAMSLGNPVVTTIIGVEGIDAEANNNLLIADDAVGFANKIIQLSTDPVYSSFISKNARSLVENKYSWDTIGSSLAAILN
ncbi:MAG: glycosyltransferase family 4 protein [Ferruginibacter sp.]